MEITFKNNHIIYEQEIRCVIRENEFNYSQNPTLQTGSFGELKEFALNDDFSPYFTTVGLYNDNNELLAVAKLNKPLKKDFTKELLLRIKLDFLFLLGFSSLMSLFIK